MKRLKKSLYISFCIIFAFIFSINSFAISSLTPASSLSDGSYYLIRNKNSNCYLDAENQKNNNVIQYAYHGALNQVWKLQRVNTNVYRLISQSPYYQTTGRKCLSVSEYTDDVDLYYLNTNLSTQKWTITYNSDGTFTIKSLFDNKVLQTQNSALGTADVIKSTFQSGSNSQKWYFEKVPSPNTTRMALETSFPENRYWNHPSTSPNSYTSTTSSACTHHGNCTKSNGSYNGACGCNCYYSSIQCNGYARYLCKLIYNTDIPNWSCSTNSNDLYLLKPGDYVRYNGHSLIIVDI